MTRIDVDGDDPGDGLLSLVVAVVEVLVETMEREAIRRMESDELTDDQVERLGQQLHAVETEIADIKDAAGIESAVDDVRSTLDGVVDDALHSAVTERAGTGPPAADGFEGGDDD